MCFDASTMGQRWNNDPFLELAWGSDPNDQDAVIQYYKGPKLLHEDKVMVKGTVFVHRVKPN